MGTDPIQYKYWVEKDTLQISSVICLGELLYFLTVVLASWPTT